MLFWELVKNKKFMPNKKVKALVLMSGGLDSMLTTRLLLEQGKERENLEKLAQKGDIMVKLKNMVGPTTLMRIKNLEFRIKNEESEVEVPNALKMSELKMDEEKSKEEILNIAALLTGYYATKARGRNVRLEVKIKK
jgi:diphthamide synthase (EF-2-diphthine--ammonia ligase)